ncbi:MAG TPA: hypothetical protein VNO50_18080 [Pyrinomonadaceae bacterium]|nr:hypothetical protein [Pyrinomonadaceae bacterium]
MKWRKQNSYSFTSRDEAKFGQASRKETLYDKGARYSGEWILNELSEVRRRCCANDEGIKHATKERTVIQVTSGEVQSWQKSHQHRRVPAFLLLVALRIAFGSC